MLSDRLSPGPGGNRASLAPAGCPANEPRRELVRPHKAGHRAGGRRQLSCLSLDQQGAGCSPQFPRTLADKAALPTLAAGAPLTLRRAQDCAPPPETVSSLPWDRKVLMGRSRVQVRADRTLREQQCPCNGGTTMAQRQQATWVRSHSKRGPNWDSGSQVCPLRGSSAALGLSLLGRR